MYWRERCAVALAVLGALGAPALGPRPAAAAEREPLTPLFYARLDHPVGAAFDNARDVAPGDFDGDGVLDLAVAICGDYVQILFGGGAGTFESGGDVYIGHCPVALSAGDFDGNGAPDLAAALGEGGNAVAVLLNLGGGDFSDPLTFPVGSDPGDVLAADFDGDGALDLVTANGASHDVSVLRGDGTGNFSLVGAYAAGAAPTGLATADFDGDGRPDLAVSDRTGNVVSVLRGLGDAAFAEAQPHATGAGPRALVAADFNRDGHPDLAAAAYGAGSVSVLLNDGSGGFLAAGAVQPGIHAYHLVAADFDGDEALDLATANHNGGVALLRGSGAGTFGVPVILSRWLSPRGLIASAVGGAVRPDLVVLDDRQVSVFMNDSAGLREAPRYCLGGYSAGIVSADFDGDGRADLACTVEGSSTSLGLLYGRAAGRFSDPAFFAIEDWGFALVSADFDGDGAADLAYGAYQTLGVRYNDGQGGFPGPGWTAGWGATSISVADFDEDGRPDLATVEPNARDVLIWRNAGPRQFQLVRRLEDGFDFQFVTSADFGADGHADLVVSNTEWDELFVYAGRGDGSFAPPLRHAVSTPTQSAFGRLDGDAIPDLVVLNEPPEGSPAWAGLSVLAGREDGTFEPARFYPLPRTEWFGSLALADFNQDGLNEVAVADWENSAVHILLGDGSDFRWGGSYGVSGPILPLLAGDLDGDGAADLVAGSDCLNLLLHRPPCYHDGDVDADEAVSVGDARHAFLLALGWPVPTAAAACAADCDGNGVITANDAKGIFAAALGLGGCLDPLPGGAGR